VNIIYTTQLNQKTGLSRALFKSGTLFHLGSFTAAFLPTEYSERGTLERSLGILLRTVYLHILYYFISNKSIKE